LSGAVAGHGRRAAVGTSGTCGLWRGCCGRNPTDAERILLQALTRDSPLCAAGSAVNHRSGGTIRTSSRSCTGSRSSWVNPCESASIAAPTARHVAPARAVLPVPLHAVQRERDRKPISCGSNRACGSCSSLVPYLSSFRGAKATSHLPVTVKALIASLRFAWTVFSIRALAAPAPSLTNRSLRLNTKHTANKLPASAPPRVSAFQFRRPTGEPLPVPRGVPNAVLREPHGGHDRAVRSVTPFDGRERRLLRAHSQRNFFDVRTTTFLCFTSETLAELL